MSSILEKWCNGKSVLIVKARVYRNVQTEWVQQRMTIGILWKSNPTFVLAVCSFGFSISHFSFLSCSLQLLETTPQQPSGKLTIQHHCDGNIRSEIICLGLSFSNLLNPSKFSILLNYYFPPLNQKVNYLFHLLIISFSLVHIFIALHLF